MNHPLKIRFNIFLIFLSIFFLDGLFPVGAKAVSKVGISVDQSVVSFDAAFGEIKSFSLVVKNITSEKQIVSVELSDMELGDQNETTFIAGNNEAYGMKNWIEAGGEKKLLEAGEEYKIGFNVNVPQNAAVGSHYTAVLIRSFPEINADNFQSTVVSGQVAVIVLSNVKGAISGKGKLASFSAPILAGKNVQFKTEYENDGNIHYIPHGEVKMTNLLTKNKKDFSFEKHFVFPGKKFSFKYGGELPSLFGIYRAQAAFVDGDGNQITKSRLMFGQLSFLPAIAFLATLFFITRFVMKQRKMSMDELMRKRSLELQAGNQHQSVRKPPRKIV